MVFKKKAFKIILKHSIKELFFFRYLLNEKMGQLINPFKIPHQEKS